MCIFSPYSPPKSCFTSHSALPTPPVYFQISHNLSFGSLIIPAKEAGITLTPAVQIINKCSRNRFYFSNLKCPYFSLEFAQRPPFSVYYRASHYSTRGGFKMQQSESRVSLPRFRKMFGSAVLFHLSWKALFLTMHHLKLLTFIFVPHLNHKVPV